MSRLIAQFGNQGLQPEDAPFAIDTTSAAGARSSALTNAEAFISQLLGVLTVVSGIFFILYFVLGAFKWVTAGGEAAKVQKARDQMVQGVLGMIIIVAAYGIIGLVGTILGMDILRPGAALDLILPASTP
jgi:hypothetical protein